MAPKHQKKQSKAGKGSAGGSTPFKADQTSKKKIANMRSGVFTSQKQEDTSGENKIHDASDNSATDGKTADNVAVMVQIGKDSAESMMAPTNALDIIDASVPSDHKLVEGHSLLAPLPASLKNAESKIKTLVWADEDDEDEGADETQKLLGTQEDKAKAEEAGESPMQFDVPDEAEIDEADPEPSQVVVLADDQATVGDNVEPVSTLNMFAPEFIPINSATDAGEDLAEHGPATDAEEEQYLSFEQPPEEDPNLVPADQGEDNLAELLQYKSELAERNQDLVMQGDLIKQLQDQVVNLTKLVTAREETITADKELLARSTKEACKAKMELSIAKNNVAAAQDAIAKWKEAYQKSQASLKHAKFQVETFTSANNRLTRVATTANAFAENAVANGVQSAVAGHRVNTGLHTPNLVTSKTSTTSPTTGVDDARVKALATASGRSEAIVKVAFGMGIGTQMAANILGMTLPEIAKH